MYYSSKIAKARPHSAVWSEYTSVQSSGPCNIHHFRPVVPGAAVGAMATPDFGRSVNPISTGGGGGIFCPHIFRPSDIPDNDIHRVFAASPAPVTEANLNWRRL